MLQQRDYEGLQRPFELAYIGKSEHGVRSGHWAVAAYVGLFGIVARHVVRTTDLRPSA
jgi:hypothetical protein